MNIASLPLQSLVRKRTAYFLKPEEQRRGARYSLELPLRYIGLYRRKSLVSGTGCTVDMSSNGLLFTTDQYLEAGLDVELWIDWPARLHDETALQLVVSGRVVRVAGPEAAIRMKRCEFHTRGSAERHAEHEEYAADRMSLELR